MKLQFLPVTWSPGRRWRCWAEVLLPITVRTHFNPAPMAGPSAGGGAPAGGRAFTLIEMIGVMAVIAITAAMLLPPVTAQVDIAAAGQESATTLSFITALQNNIQRNHVIPGVTNWVSIVASELGMNPTNVAFTCRNQPRLLLVDTNGFGLMTLPYTETTSGMPDALTNSTLPRILIVSSLGTALPALVGTNGYPSSANFNALWNAAAGTVPTNSPWNTWTGNAGDITVQRLNVGYLFAHLVLNNLDLTNAPYSINGSAVINLPATNQVNAYFLTATVLNLYLANTNLEASQILNMDSSWYFSGGGWRNAPAPAPSPGSISNATVVASSDVSDCFRQFNCQSFCTNACNPWNSATPNKFCCDMTNYMGLYQQYASCGFAKQGISGYNRYSQPIYTNTAVWTQLQTCCSQLNSDCSSLCSYSH